MAKSNFAPTSNNQPPLTVKSNADDGADVTLWADPVTHKLLADVAVTATVDTTGLATSAKQDTLAGLVGEVQASPTANTLLARLKDILTGVVLAAGTNAIGKLAANSGVDIGDVDVTSIAAGTNLIGDVGIQPRTGNGLTTFMASGSDGSTALTSTAQAIKASAGQVFGYYIYNPNATAQFVHFYNTASASVTVGTTNPLFTLTIPATSAANLMGDIGIKFTNAGFSCAATSTAGGNGAPATALDVVVWYA